MPAQSWESRAAAQSKALAAAGVVGNDSAAIAALLAGQSGRVQLALLDRADLDATEWRKVLLSARLPSMGEAPHDWSIADEYGNVLDEPPDTPGGLLLHEDGDHALMGEMSFGYYEIGVAAEPGAANSCGQLAPLAPPAPPVPPAPVAPPAHAPPPAPEPEEALAAPAAAAPEVGSCPLSLCPSRGVCVWEGGVGAANLWLSTCVARAQAAEAPRAGASSAAGSSLAHHARKRVSFAVRRRTPWPFIASTL